MLTNYHTHTTFCDGKDSPEAVVLSALEKGFAAIGFSAHGDTPFDKSYCIRSEETYRAAILELKEKYKKDIQIYLGVEEDMYAPADRSKYEYLIGSSHYCRKDGQYCAVDMGLDNFYNCIKMFGGDPLAMAESYFSSFCDYVLQRKPDIVGHFDLLTKYEEMEPGAFNSGNPAYVALANKYMTRALQSGCLFEMNTGAISRGYRETPYPSVELLHTMKKNDARIILSADSHSADSIDCHFEECRALLKDVGFTHTYVLYNGEFVKDTL